MVEKYGYEKTLHCTTKLNIERDKKTGKVVAVWFRCLPLPFTDDVVDSDRSKEMIDMYADPKLQQLELLAVDVEGI